MKVRGGCRASWAPPLCRSMVLDKYRLAGGGRGRRALWAHRVKESVRVGDAEADNGRGVLHGQNRVPRRVLETFFRSGAHASVGPSMFVVKARPKAIAETLVPCMFLFMTDNTQALRDTIQVLVARHSLCPTRLGMPLSWPQ